MSQDEIIEMAKKVGMRYREIKDEFHSGYADGVYLDELKDFARLVAEKQRVKDLEICLHVKYDPTYQVRETFALNIKNQNEKTL